MTKKRKRPKKKISLSPLQKYYLQFFLMTSPLDSHRTTDIKPEMLSGVQTGNGTPHCKYNMRGIAHIRTKRKDDIFMQRRLLIERFQDSALPYIAVEVIFNDRKKKLMPMLSFWYLFKYSLGTLGSLLSPAHCCGKISKI